MTHPMPARPAAPLFLRALAILLFTFALLGVPAGTATAQPVSSFADLAESLSPAVVNISTAQTVEQPEGHGGPRLPEGNSFEDLFRDFFESIRLELVNTGYGLSIRTERLNLY